MPIDPEPNNSSGTNKSRSGWLAKCGLILPSLSNRERGSPEEGLNKLSIRGAMRSGDSKRNKRKRSPMPADRLPVKMTEKRDAQDDMATAKCVFESELNSFPSHEEYAARRKEMLEQEKVISWDWRARQSASAIELKAAHVIWKIREHERDNLFGNKASEAIPDKTTLDMGGQFLTNQSRIEYGSKLFKIAMRMPKGALLHLHFNAELHPETLLEEARSMPNMFIRSTQPLLSKVDLDVTEMVFNVVPDDTPSADLFSSTYNPEWKQPGSQPWMRWSTFRDEFDKRYGDDYRDKKPNEEAFILNKEQSAQRNVTLQPAERWIKAKMILSEDEAYGLSQTVNGVWARFNQATRCFKGLLNYERVFKRYIGKAIDRMIDERIMYAELRPMLMDKFIPSDDGRGKVTHDDQMRLIIEGVREKQEELRTTGELHKFPFGLKIIYCTPRSIPKPKMRSEMQDCIDLKIKFPDLICGFDLVGAEDRPNHIGFYHDELVAFARTCKEMNLDIPFMFHAGETLLDTGGSKTPANSNLYDAALLKSKRIGHGFSLMKHPHLIEEFKKEDICIELCPISNELLHLCRNIKEHPFPQLLAAGIPCTVNSDNPSLFSNSMSHEFYQVMVGTPMMTIHGWRQLAEWSLTYSCLSEAEKREGFRIFKDSWEEFCQEIVDQYGKYADGLILSLT